MGEGLFGALRLTLRAALKRVVSRCSTRTLIEGSHPSPRRTGSLGIGLGLSATYEMVVGEGLFGALRLTLRAALKRVVSRCSTRTLIEGSHPSPRRTGSLGIILGMVCNMRDGGGRRIRTFEVCDGRFTVCSLWPLGNPTWDSDVA